MAKSNQKNKHLKFDSELLSKIEIEAAKENRSLNNFIETILIKEIELRELTNKKPQ